jgi:hypothetical protein
MLNPGDVLDKLSIAILKHEYTNEQSISELLDLFNEFSYLAVIFKDAQLISALYNLKSINERIFNLESAVRKGALDNDLPEVGNRAVLIRKTNAERISVKNTVNIMCGVPLRTKKSNHLSEGDIK